MAKVHVTYPVVWADIELPGIAPAPDNGWNNVYTSPCSGTVRQRDLHPRGRRPRRVQRVRHLHHGALDVQGRRLLRPRHLDAIFGTGSASLIPNTYEWTYQPETAQPQRQAVRLVPVRWQGAVRAVLRRADQREQVRPDVAVVGRRRRHATPYGDYDQIDIARR